MVFLAGTVCSFAIMFHSHDAMPEPRYRHDHPADADAYFYGQRMWPDNRIPDGWYDRARTHIARMRSMGLSKSAGWKWISVGPFNVAGRVRAMAMDPSDPAILYAGSAGGGVWKTTDAGTSWTALTDFLPNLRIGSIAVDPYHTSTVLAGNGEGFVAWQGGLAYGRGIYKTKDGGQNWELIPATATADFEYVFDISFDPFIDGAVIASTRKGLFRSTDGGTNWTRVLTGGTMSRGMMAAFSRTSEGLVYGVLEGLGIYRSTDHGVTWNALDLSGLGIGSFSRIVVAPAPSNGDIVYAAFTAEDETCAGLFRSTNRGDAWISIATPTNQFWDRSYMGEQGNYNSVLVVHPTNPNTVIAGGIELYRTTNGGQSWKQISNWYEGTSLPYVHCDNHAVIYNTADTRQWYSANDGGVFRTDNDGATFLDKNTGLVTAQFHSGTPHPVSDMIIGGTIDNGNLLTSDASSWTDVTGGDGGWTAIDYNTPSTMFSELYYLHFMKSTQGGIEGSWKMAMNGIPRASDYGTSDPVNFMAPFEMDANNPGLLYAGTNKIYRTTNGAQTWMAISPAISGTGVLSAIGLSASSSQIIYAAGTTGMLQVSTNGGSTWTRATSGLPTRYITDIAVDRADPATAYVTVSAFGTGHIYKTTNTGGSWTSISGSGATGLPDVPANTLVIHPSDPNQLFVGTDVGLFYSSDCGATWVVNNEGLGNVTISDLQFKSNGVLIAATHGRGMYRTDFSLTDTQRTPNPEAFTLMQNFPNPVPSVTGMTAIPYTLNEAGVVTISLYDIRGALVRKYHKGYQLPGDYSAHIETLTLAAGPHFYRLTLNRRTSRFKSMVVVK
jgi:photosystem II stability/assembly factor-like uncharacterized protein